MLTWTVEASTAGVPDPLGSSFDQITAPSLPRTAYTVCGNHPVRYTSPSNATGGVENEDWLSLTDHGAAPVAGASAVSCPLKLTRYSRPSP